MMPCFPLIDDTVLRLFFATYNIGVLTQEAICIFAMRFYLKRQNKIEKNLLSLFKTMTPIGTLVGKTWA